MMMFPFMLISPPIPLYKIAGPAYQNQIADSVNPSRHEGSAFKILDASAALFFCTTPRCFVLVSLGFDMSSSCVRVVFRYLCIRR